MIYNYYYNCTYVEFTRSQAFPTVLHIRLSASVRAAIHLQHCILHALLCSYILPLYWLWFPPRRTWSFLKQWPCLILLYVPEHYIPTCCWLCSTYNMWYPESEEYGSVFPCRLRFYHHLISRQRARLRDTHLLILLKVVYLQLRAVACFQAASSHVGVSLTMSDLHLLAGQESHQSYWCNCVLSSLLLS